VPIGEHPVTLAPEEWDGTWLTSDGSAVVEVTDGPNGILKLAFVDGLEMEILEVHVRSSGDWMFGSFIGPEPDPAENTGGGHQAKFYWARIRHDPDQIVIWSPDTSKLRTLVEEGILPGNLGKDEGFEGRDVYLGKLTPEHYNIITSSAEGVLLDWEDPQVLIRYSK
jgi:hypothetical protein